MNYGQIKSLVEGFLQRAESELAVTWDQLLPLADELIAKTLRLESMEKTWSTTITTAETALPADFIEFKNISATINGRECPLTKFPKGYLDALTSGEGGDPVGYSVFSGVIEIGPRSADIPIAAVYYAKPAAMASDIDSNVISDNNGSVYLYALLYYASMSIQDKSQADAWLSALEAEIELANTAARWSDAGDAPQMVPA